MKDLTPVFLCQHENIFKQFGHFSKFVAHLAFSKPNFFYGINTLKTPQFAVQSLKNGIMKLTPSQCQLPIN